MALEIRCDTCGQKCKGGARRYVGANGDQRIGCADERACASAFSSLSREERRLIDACRAAGSYLERARSITEEGAR